MIRNFIYAIKRPIIKFFGFSNQETNGFILLILLIFILLLTPIIFNYINQTSNQSYINDKKRLDSLVQLIERKNISISKTTIINPHSFDPNTTSLRELIEIGVSKNIAERIIHYRTKGGKFFTPSDLKKIYGINDSIYSSLYSYVSIPQKLTSFSKKKISKKPISYSTTFSLIDINSTDTTELKKIKGIGSKLASRIIGYRNLLGGYINKNQYHEIFGLDSVIVKELQAKTEIASNFNPTYININEDSFEKMKSHPYLKYKIAKLITAYRTQHGKFNSLEELKKIKEISEIEWKKLFAYLIF